jgi:molecular chaperone GrpE
MADETERATEAHEDQNDPNSEHAPDEGFDPVSALEAAEAAWEAERSEMRDRLMRALAEMENVRKRGEKDRREAALYGGAKLARDLLPVFDNLSRALALVDDAARAQMQGVVDGVDLTLRELTNVMAKHGVELVSPEPGAAFDPHMHEAMFEAPVPGFAPGTVIQVVAEGFRMHDQLLRPAKVGVASRAH